MKIRDDIAGLLRDGVPQIEIARRLRCGPITVQRTREALGIPSPGAGRRPVPATFQEAFAVHAVPGADGHTRWTGHTNPDGTPIVHALGKARSGYRVAFTLRYGREPVGRVTAGCGVQGCVSGDHVVDQPMREKNRSLYAAIFGGAA